MAKAIKKSKQFNSLQDELLKLPQDRSYKITITSENGEQYQLDGASLEVEKQSVELTTGESILDDYVTIYVKDGDVYFELVTLGSRVAGEGLLKKIIVVHHSKSVANIELDLGKLSKSNNPKPVKQSDLTLVEIVGLSMKIRGLNSNQLLQYYQQYGYHNHPYIARDMGVLFFIHDELELAKELFIAGASFGLSDSSIYYNTPYSDAIGSCFMHLVTQFLIDHNVEAQKIVALAYLMYSKCIVTDGNSAYDSLIGRATLLAKYDTNLTIQGFFLNEIGLGFLIDPLIISDFYNCSLDEDSPYFEEKEHARTFHRRLGDIKIGGKDADEYELSQMAQLGTSRHIKVFNHLEKKYFQGKFNINQKDFESLFSDSAFSLDVAENDNLDLTDIFFESSDHLRYQNSVHVSGPHGGARRAVKIEPNISGGEGYSVTIYNLDGNHPLWRDNVQMATKPMKIVTQLEGEIQLRGFGKDMMGESFADYGLSIVHDDGDIQSITLHMHDRNIDIEYLK